MNINIRYILYQRNCIDETYTLFLTIPFNLKFKKDDIKNEITQ